MSRHVELRIGDTILAISNREALTREGLREATSGHPRGSSCGATRLTRTSRRCAPQARDPVGPRDQMAGLRRAYVADPDGDRIVLVSTRAYG